MFAYSFLFLWVITSLCYWGNAGLVNLVWKCSFLLNFMEELRKVINSSLILIKFTMKPSGFGCFFFGRFLITNSISLLVIFLFRYSIFHDSVFLGCLFLGIYLFLLGCPVCYYIIVHNNFPLSFKFL